MTEKKPAPSGVAVTFAREWTIGDKTYKPDQAAVLDPDDADVVLRYGYARPDDAHLAQVHGFPVPTSKKEG